MVLRAKDIAEMLGVSTATVSLVLNNKPGVGDQKRQEIIEKIRELGCDYLLKDIPVTNGNIGFVVYKTIGKIVDESPFFNYILEGLNSSLTDYGYNLSFVYMNRSTPLEVQEMQLRSSDCKGFLIFGVEMQREDLQVFIDTGLPFVVLDNSFQDSDVDSVSINNFQGISKAMQYAYDMGHREIGYIRCRERITSFLERYQAYKNCMKKFGLKIKESYIWDVNYSEKTIREEVGKYLSENNENPTIFIAENDFIACHAIHGIQDYGYRVPEDISVIGFDDRPVCQMIVPSVTTVNVPKNAFGSAAVELLMEKMQNPRDYSMKTEIGTKLIVRKSVNQLK